MGVGVDVYWEAKKRGGGDGVELNTVGVGVQRRPDWRSIGKREPVGCLEAISNR
jgi:hypothetical protein